MVKYIRPSDAQIVRAVEERNRGKDWWRVSEEVFKFPMGLLSEEDVKRIKLEQERIGAVVR